MISLGKIISTELDNLKRRVIKITRMGRDDVQTPIEIGAYGLDSNPIKDFVAAYAETKQKGKNVILGYYVKNKKAEVGEFRFFCTDDNGAEKFYVWLKKGGLIEIGGNTNYAVKYNELKQELDTLKQDHNTLVQIVKQHTHPTNFSIITTTTSLETAALQNNQSDFSKAKNDKIKTIG